MTSVSLALAILAGDHTALVIAFFCLAGSNFPGLPPGLVDSPLAFLGKWLPQPPSAPSIQSVIWADS